MSMPVSPHPSIGVPAARFFPAGRLRALMNYLGFIHRVILPAVSKGGDYAYAQHADDIEYVAGRLRETLGYTQQPLYRGVLVEHTDIDDNGRLVPIPHIRYLSFSESSTVANTFADPASPMSDFLAADRPHARGYLIEYTAPSDEVLFSWRWAAALNLDALGAHLERRLPAAPPWDPDLVTSQQEVIVRQAGRFFTLQPYRPDLPT